MVSRSLRGEIIPKNVILFTDNDVVPCDYSLYSCFNGKYIKQVNRSNPGACVGNATHTSGAGGAHIHNRSSGAHTHGIRTEGGSGSVQATNFDGRQRPVPLGHRHTGTSGSSTANIFSSRGDSHTHDAQNNDPPYYELKMLQKNQNVGLRKRQTPQNTMTLWGKSLASIPPTFINNPAPMSKNAKIVETDSTTPGSSGGNATHTHGAGGAHTHNVILDGHSDHSLSAGLLSPIYEGGQCGFSNTSSASHGHGQGTGVVQSTSPHSVSTCNGHIHDAQNNTPLSLETAFITKSSISMRSSGIEKDVITLWNCPLVSIPDKNQVADGTNCTVNYTDKYVVGIPTVNTCPGSDTGSNTHTDSNETHGHTTTLTHEHTTSGVSGQSDNNSTQYNPYSQGRRFLPSPEHTHPWGNLLPHTQTHTITTGGRHTHVSTCRKPVSKEIALIQRL